MFRRVLALSALVALLPLAVQAAPLVATGMGPRVGFSSDPDQIVFGGQVTFGEVAPSLSFDPNLELGFGDNVTVIALNFDLHYHFDTGTEWRPYAGGGVGIHFISWDVDFPGRDDSDTEIGGSAVVGAGVPTAGGNRFFSELKLGLGDIPELKLLVGWNFRM